MIEFLNVIIAALAGFVLGLAVHSAYVHSKKRGELGPMPWDHPDGGEGDEEG